MHVHKTPWLLKQLYPSLLWHLGRNEKTIYLTFDDGPVPGVTDFVLAQLRRHNATATFFCVGDNIRKHPGIFTRLLEAGHRVGNHTHNHLSGWRHTDHDYIANIEKCESLLPDGGKKLFRPPYGKIKRSQIRTVRKTHQIIMWDVLTGDFDCCLRPEVCLEKSIACTQNGSIVIFHDSYKAERNLRRVLPGYLQYFSRQGYQFLAL